jgi:type II secretion system protein N
MDGRKLLRTGGYLLFGGFALLFFFYVTFPAQAVGQRLAHELQKMSGGKLHVTFDEVSLYRLSGVSAERVKIKTIPAQGDPFEVEVDELWVRLQLAPLLLLDVAASAGVGVGDGSVEIDLTDAGDKYELEVEIDNLDFATPPLLSDLAGIPIRGTLTGKVEGVISVTPQRLPGDKTGPPRFAPERSEGKASLTVRDLGIGPGSIKGFTIPAPVSFGQLDMAIDLQRGRARVASFKQQGGQVTLDLSGSTTLRRTVAASTLDTCVKLKFADEEYLREYPKINTALQLAQVQFQKDGAGFLNIRLGGTIGRPKRQRGVCRSGREPSTARGTASK